MEVRTILWPTDLSRNSIKAARHVESLAEKYQAKVIVLYVGVDLLSHFPAWGDVPSETHVKHFQDFEMRHARKRLEEVCEENLKACPAFEMRLVQGDPAAEILKTAQESQADMIVLTTHGRGAENLDQRSPEFGSVARKVLGGSPVPVHLVNPFGD
jgi:nucleotide-binding universal stress UspA family protein